MNHFVNESPQHCLNLKNPDIEVGDRVRHSEKGRGIVDHSVNVNKVYVKFDEAENSSVPVEELKKIRDSKTKSDEGENRE